MKRCCGCTFRIAVIWSSITTFIVLKVIRDHDEQKTEWEDIMEPVPILSDTMLKYNSLFLYCPLLQVFPQVEYNKTKT